MHKLNFLTGGRPLADATAATGDVRPNAGPNGSGAGAASATASKALILLHGRGGSAEDILTLARALPVKDFALFAPQAEGHSWYPYSFLSPPQQNEPWLGGALEVVGQLVAHVEAQGVGAENIWFTGFSQGACLMLEFLARNARRYGGAVAFTGGLIGDHIYPHHYHGDFQQTPVFIGTGNPDPHVPVQRVHETTAQLKSMHAAVTGIVYPGMGHTITDEEIREAARVAF
ncbi:MAG TPA: dienelactone hydrolase family protein [Puia sp.]|nr:dienelactone hydrolase family protein [Puia sp.]